MAHASQLTPPQRGIHYWMQQVLLEADKARDGFRSDPVHDLRVAIRRCRSMAEGFGALDPDSNWKNMRRAVKPVFSSLGELRDVQVQVEWLDRLARPQDPVRARLAEHFGQREHELKAVAEKELADFDTQQWQQWMTVLPERAQLLPSGEEIFPVMALERWRNARQLHSAALRNRSKASVHALRIGLKKFRYIAENFLPELHEQWHKDLKKLQDALGDVHDLDVLSDTARAIHAYRTPRERQMWTRTLQRERKQRLDANRSKMVGKRNLWQRWRNELPQGETLHAAILKTFEIWSQFRDPDVAHTQRVLSVSLAIFNQLGDSRRFEGVALRDLLRVAVLAHEVGRGQGKHHKKTVRMLDRLETPPDWKPIHLHVAGMIARYHRGAPPRPSQAKFASLPAAAKPIVVLLGGVLRLADALDKARNGRENGLQVEQFENVLRIKAEGFEPLSKAAENVAAARFLLESAIGLPVQIQG